MKTKADFRTLCVHAGELKDTQHGGAISPLYANPGSYTMRVKFVLTEDQ